MGLLSGYAVEDDLESLRKFTIKAAKELGYPKKIADKLKKAKNVNEINFIMLNARRKYLYDM